MPLNEKLLLRKSLLIETVNDLFKYVSQIEHTGHRSSLYFMVNIHGALAAYAILLNYHLILRQMRKN